MQAGAEAKTPPKFIQQAEQEIQVRQIQAREQRQKLKNVLSSAGVALALRGFWTFKTLLAGTRLVATASSR